MIVHSKILYLDSTINWSHLEAKIAPVQIEQQISLYERRRYEKSQVINSSNSWNSQIDISHVNSAR